MKIGRTNSYFCSVNGIISSSTRAVLMNTEVNQHDMSWKEESSKEEVIMSHEKILIVEHDEKVASYLEKTLISFDYLVTGVASSGKHALSMAQKMPVDLVLMDSVLNGPHEVVITANSILSLKNIPIIYLIPQDNDDLIIRAKNRLPNGFLTKPVDEQKLLTIIRRALIYHVWRTISTENESKCYTQYKKAVSIYGKKKIRPGFEIKCLNPHAKKQSGWHTDQKGVSLDVGEKIEEHSRHQV